MDHETLDPVIAKAGAGMAYVGGGGAFVSWLTSNQWVWGALGVLIAVIGLVIQTLFSRKRDRRDERETLANELAAQAEARFYTEQIERLKRLPE